MTEGEIILSPSQPVQLTAPSSEGALERRNIMDFYKVPIGFGMALAQNTAAMNRYAHLSEAQKQAILNKAHNVRSEKEMYALVASLANGTIS